MYEFIAPAIVTAASYLLIRYVERAAEKINGGRLPPWRRVLIPVPLILFLVANLDGILSLLSYLDIHVAVPARYQENQAWNNDRFFIAGIVSFLLVSLLLVPRPHRALRFVWNAWVIYILWIMLPLCLLFLATGFPLRD